MNAYQDSSLPSFVVFEGVDGSGKTTLAQALAKYYARLVPQKKVYADSFPGSLPGTLGEWVYRLHHNQLKDLFSPRTIAPPALQLLHIAAHVDTILNRIIPAFSKGGLVILDRYWWSAYSYARLALPAELVWPLVNAERSFLRDVPQPRIIYLTRDKSLKGNEITPGRHEQLNQYYREVIESEKQAIVNEISNNGHLENTWEALLSALDIPFLSINALDTI